GEVEILERQIEQEEKRLTAAPPPTMINSQSAGKIDNSGDARDSTGLIRSQLKAVQVEIQQRLKSQEALTKQINSLQGRLEVGPLREQEMAATTRDVSQLRTAYTTLLDKKMNADMASDLEKRQKSERFNILDNARVP